MNQENAGDTLWYDSYLGWNKGMHYTPEPLFTVPQSIDEDLQKFIDFPFHSVYENVFFTDTALPMLRSWQAHKEHQYEEAISYLQYIPALDWKKAATEWIERRKDKWESWMT